MQSGFSCVLKSKMGVRSEAYCQSEKKLKSFVETKKQDGFVVLRGVEKDSRLSDNDNVWVNVC